MKRLLKNFLQNFQFTLFFYRDLRARLEMAVDHILEACSRIECITDTDCTTTSTSSTASEDGSDQPEFLMNSPLVTTIVRRELAIAIRDLMQHGMISVSKRYNLTCKGFLWQKELCNVIDRFKCYLYFIGMNENDSCFLFKSRSSEKKS